VPPATTFSLIRELVHRDGLRIALAGRDDVLLEPILRWLLKYIADPRFGELVANVTSLVLGKFAFNLIGRSLTSNFRYVCLSYWSSTPNRCSFRAYTKENHFRNPLPGGSAQSKGCLNHDIILDRIEEFMRFTCSFKIPLPV